MRIQLLLSLLLLACSACLKIDNTFTKLPPGPWRAVLLLDPSAITPNPKGEPREDKLNLTFEEVTDGELPFNFEVVYSDDSTFHIVFQNGEERIKSENVSFGRSKSRAKDSIRVDFPVYDTYIVGLFEQGLIEGKWVVNYKDNYEIPFVARFGEDHRFTTVPKVPSTDISGTWEVLFEDDDGPYPAIGEFVQKYNSVTGTFRTETGDYRYLQGQISGRKLYLSVFDGSHAFLFEAQLEEDGDNMVGFFRSGAHYKAIWTAKRNANATLTSPNALTKATGPDQRFQFAFPSVTGDTVRLNDAAYADKIKLVQIMGTWCPNCRDETNFLVNYLKENNHPDLAVFGIGFERYRNGEKAIAALKTYQQQMEVSYPLMWGGYYNKSEATEALPGLDKVISYPTLLFIDRDNRIRKIHTGFNGPATSQFAAFEQEFAQTLRELLAEKN